MPTRKKMMVKAVIEIAFIIFLFYANLLMGEFTGTNGLHRTLHFAVRDVLTKENFAIGLVAAILGHAVFEFMRRRLV